MSLNIAQMISDSGPRSQSASLLRYRDRGSRPVLVSW